MVSTPAETAREDEMPISPTPDSSVPDIFSTKKIFFLNSSYSGSRRSEIPHIEADYCPRDEVSRRLFHHTNNSCDCDCASDGCWGCIRRNRQCFCKVFVLVLSILLIILLFGSLSYNLTRNKDTDESFESDQKTEWASHDHQFSTSDTKDNFLETGQSKTKLKLPISLYETLPEDDNSGGDFQKVQYSVVELGPNLNQEDIEPLAFKPLDSSKFEPTLLIYDAREPHRRKRSISPRNKKLEIDLLNKHKDKFDKGVKKKSIQQESINFQQNLETYRKTFNQKAHTVFQPFSLTTPAYSTPLESYEYSLEENDLEEELKLRFLNPDLKNFESQEKIKSEGDVGENFSESKNSEKENEKTEKTTNYDLIGRYVEDNLINELLGISTKPRNDVEVPRNGDAKFYSFTDEDLIPTTEYFQLMKEYHSTKGYTKEYIAAVTKEAKILLEEVSEVDEKHGSENTTLIDNQNFRGSDLEYRTFSNLFQMAVPFAELFGISHHENSNQNHEETDRVKGISLAEAKEQKKERRKHLLLNSRVVGGSSDVRLPTGPDVSKPFINAVETLKTNQQLSFMPSATSQYILPYQMCFFANPVPGLKPYFHVGQPRTFPLRPSSLYPTAVDSAPKQHTPSQQNFLSFNINNFANSPPMRQIPSGSSVFNFPPLQQNPFLNVPGSPRQPIFCTNLQPPLFQFPTVPGTADFSHAKCTDCDEETYKHGLSGKENFFSPAASRDTICADNSIPCRDGSNCIPVNHWCDNQVQCKDASDEAFCSCRERISKEKLCDGYIDCPHGEDEIGCFNCPKSAFTCDNIVSPGSCIPLSKRCDGVRDCASGVDESECSALFFNVRFNDTFSVSQMKGFLHRNWKGDWFPVCVEIRDNAWAREACFGELGFLSQDLHVTFVPVPNHYKGPFIVRQEDGTPTLQDHCKGHISTYVKCPAMSCGTRVEFPNMQEFESRFRRFILNYSNGSKSNSTAGSTNSIPQPKIIKNVVRPKREETGRVVGGRESEPRAWPWAIALYKDGAFHCGGVILDEKWVLTAAHCLEQYWKHFYEVRGGMLRRFSFSAMEQVRTVTHAIIHESYNPAIMSNDIAVLRLKEPFQFNRWVRPACLPSLQDGLSKFLWGPVPGTRCIAVGWGALRERGYDPDQLREVEIPIMRRCKHKEDLAGAEICAGKAEGGKDTCQGDSGGPLLCRDSGIPSSWYVAGIVSHGEGCARPGEPGAYTRISLFVDWITANTNDFQLPTVKPLSSCPGLRCRSGSKLCLPIKWVCNGFTDCLEAEDEKNCSTRFVISEIFNEQYEGGPKSMEKKIELKVIKDDVSTLKKSTPISKVMLTTEAIPEEKLKKNEKVSFVESGKNSRKWEKAIEVLPSLKNKGTLSLIIEEQLGETTNKSEEEKKFSTENPIANLKNGPLTTEMFVKSSKLSNLSEVLNMSVKPKTTDGHFTYQTKEMEVLTTQTTKKITEVEANNSEESVAQNLWSTIEKNEGEMGYSKTLLATETTNSDIRLGDKLMTNDKNVDILNQVSEKTTEPSITVLGTFKPSENKMDFNQGIEDKIVFQKINSVATTTTRNNILAVEDAKTFKTITDEALQVVKSTVDMKDHSISSEDEDETESSFISEDKDLDELEKEEAEDKILTIDDKTPTGSNDTNGSWMGDKDSKSQESEEESKEEEYKDILNTSNILTKVYESSSESLLKSPPVEFYQKEKFKETTIKALANEIDEISSNKVEQITTEFQPLSTLFITYDSEERTLDVYEKTEVATSAEKFFENYLPGTKKHVMEYENFKATTSMEEEPKIGTNFYIAKEEAEKKSQIAFATESIQSLDIETENKGNVKIEKDWLKYEELEVTTPKPLQQNSNPQTNSYIRKQITENESENKLTTKSLKISDAKTKTESYDAEKATASTDYLEEFEIGENISLAAQKIVKLTEAITEGQLNSDFSSEKIFVENDWFEATRTTNESQEKEEKKNFQNIHISKITESEKEAKTITIPLATTLRTNGEEFEIEYNRSAQHTLPEETVTPHVIQTRATVNTDQESSTHAGLKNQAEKVARRPALNSGANYYQCKIIVQSILASYRCDGVIDCEDGTDEENCECAKTLTPELVCDGHVDCPDYSDEKNCSLCSKKEFHCQISQTCISLRERCDGVAQCKFGEDESDCFTLVKNSDVNAPPDRETFLSTKGVLMSNKNGVWSVECQEGGAILDAGHAIEVCASLGTIGYDKYQNKTLGMNCTGFEVTCAESLISSLEKYGSSEEGYFWPWHSLVYSDGAPLCSAVLLKPQWLLAPKRCVEKVTLQQNYLSARLGTKTPLAKIEKKPSKFIFIDAIEPVHDSDMVLLHLSQKVNQTKFIRPIGIPYLFESDSQKDVCVAVGHKTVFLKIENCSPTSRCYNKRNLKSLNCKSKPWMGVIVCQSRLGWYPSSVFVEEAGDCGFRHVKFTAVQEKLDAIHLALTRQVKAFPLPNCHGFWCPEGICVPYNKTCNGWPDCPSKKDENFNMCRRMKKWRKECKITELRCKMGSCVPKTVFADGIEDCEDNSDEPTNATCLEYLRLTAPHRICDGRRNCYDKTDEDPELCPCDGFKFQCKSSHKCVPKDFVCDGEKDCPDGEDEDRCVGRKTVKNHTRSHLEIMQKSFGVWHTICPTSMTKDRSDALCRELGFEEALFTYERNQTVLTPKIDSFSWVKLNQRTSLALRGDKPFVGYLRRVKKLERLTLEVILDVLTVITATGIFSGVTQTKSLLYHFCDMDSICFSIDDASNCVSKVA